MPPNQIIIGLAMLLTFFLMSPIYTQVNKEAFQPYLAEEISQDRPLTRRFKLIRAFMLKTTRKKDIKHFEHLRLEKATNYDDISTIVLISAFP